MNFLHRTFCLTHNSLATLSHLVTAALIDYGPPINTTQ